MAGEAVGGEAEGGGEVVQGGLVGEQGGLGVGGLVQQGGLGGARRGEHDVAQGGGAAFGQHGQAGGERGVEAGAGVVEGAGEGGEGGMQADAHAWALGIRPGAVWPAARARSPAVSSGRVAPSTTARWAKVVRVVARDNPVWAGPAGGGVAVM